MWPEGRRPWENEPEKRQGQTAKAEACPLSSKFGSYLAVRLHYSDSGEDGGWKVD